MDTSFRWGGSKKEAEKAKFKATYKKLNDKLKKDKRESKLIMENFMTERNRDNLCDMLWWIKGYKKGADDNFESCPFTEDHLKTLDEVVRGMRKVLNQGGTVDPESVKNVIIEPIVPSLNVAHQLQFVRECQALPSNMSSTTEMYKAIEQTIIRGISYPDTREALKGARAIFLSQGITEQSIIGGSQLKEINYALKIQDVN